jgi:hypothetical protein
MDHPEIGRELRASDLRPNTVVVVRPPGHDDLSITLWVSAVTQDSVTFFAGDLNWMVINLVRPDGTIVDDKERVVRVFEYLGKI